MDAANASGSAVRAPTNASSHPHTSTTTGNERNVSMTRTEAASYAGLSDGRNTASGHLRAASPSGMPDRIAERPRLV